MRGLSVSICWDSSRHGGTHAGGTRVGGIVKRGWRGGDGRTRAASS